MYEPPLSASIMNSRALKPVLFTALCWLASQTAIAEIPVLTAKPGLCIVQQSDVEKCVMAIELEWKAELSDSYCLYNSLNPEPLHCWENVQLGLHHSELSSREDVDYWLQRPPSSGQLARITVRIVSLAQRNPERRRRRHVWSVM